MATSYAPASGVGRRYWILLVIALILGLSLMLSFDFTTVGFSPRAWSNFIAGVQLSTLLVVVALIVWWVRAREP